MTATSALLVVAGVVAVSVVPNLEYPVSPPSVGDPETLGMCTSLYFAMIAISLGAMIGAWMLCRRLPRRCGEWNASFPAAAMSTAA